MTINASTNIELDLKRLFGEHTSIVPLISVDQMGRRIHGVDMTSPLTAEQAELLINLLALYNIITFPGQDQTSFRLRHLERLANHFGAPIPHPKNYANYIDYKKNKVPLVLPPIDQQACTLCDQAFPDVLQCRDDANSPAVYIVTNLVGSGPDKQEEITGGLHWHTDIEFERTPLSTSMFYVQAAPTTRNSAAGNWVDNIPLEAGFYHRDSKGRSN